jgi:YVTN family beta-propeller protein
MGEYYLAKRADCDSNQVTVFDETMPKAPATLETGEYPEGIAVASDGRSVLVANWFDDTLSRIDAETLEVTESVTVGDGPRAFGNFIANIADQ